MPAPASQDYRERQQQRHHERGRLRNDGDPVESTVVVVDGEPCRQQVDRVEGAGQAAGSVFGEEVGGAQIKRARAKVGEGDRGVAAEVEGPGDVKEVDVRRDGGIPFDQQGALQIEAAEAE